MVLHCLLFKHIMLVWQQRYVKSQELVHILKLLERRIVYSRAQIQHSYCLLIASRLVFLHPVKAQRTCEGLTQPRLYALIRKLSFKFKPVSKLAFHFIIQRTRVPRYVFGLSLTP
jgi:hypothetical protein